MIFFYTNPILIAAAVIPAVFLLVHVYRADKLEKEPAPLLISLVLYGIAATFIALLLERFGGWLLGRYFPENSTPYNVLMYFGVVAFSEEGAKYFLLKRRTWNSAAFNCQFDGVVYAVFVSLGFALWENISYVLMYGLSTALVRAVTAVTGSRLLRRVHGRVVRPCQAPARTGQGTARPSSAGCWPCFCLRSCTAATTISQRSSPSITAGCSPRSWPFCSRSRSSSSSASPAATGISTITTRNICKRKPPPPVML
ncbi:MAG: PrsW family intramembrane metalloprotease [Acutalibacteraceae bacterium]